MVTFCQLHGLIIKLFCENWALARGTDCSITTSLSNAINQMSIRENFNLIFQKCQEQNTSVKFYSSYKYVK